jgi:hypothetical protein
LVPHSTSSWFPEEALAPCVKRIQVEEKRLFPFIINSDGSFIQMLYILSDPCGLSFSQISPIIPSKSYRFYWMISKHEEERNPFGMPIISKHDS